MAVDRSTTAVLTAALSVIIYILFIGVTAYSDRKPGLKGRVSVVLMALLHSLAFRLTYEACARWQYCSISTDTFRVWSAVTAIHFITAWVLFLRAIGLYIADLLFQLNDAHSEVARLRAVTHVSEFAEGDDSHD